MIFKPNTVSPNMESISLEDDEVLTLSLKGVSAPEIYDKARLFIRQNDTEKYYYTNIETKSQGNYEVTCQVNRAGVGEFIESDENNYIVNITNDDGGKIAPKIQKTSTTWKLRLYEKDSLNEDSECIFYPELDLRSSDTFMARDVKSMSDLYCQNTYFKPYLNYYALASLSGAEKESMLICNNYIPSSQIAYGTVQSSDNVNVSSEFELDPSFGVSHPFPLNEDYTVQRWDEYNRTHKSQVCGDIHYTEGFCERYSHWRLRCDFGSVGKNVSGKFKLLKIYPHNFSNQLMFGVAGIKSYQAANEFDYDNYPETADTMHEFMTKGAYEKIKDYDNKYARYYIKINGVFYKILDWRYFDWSYGYVEIAKEFEWDDDSSVYVYGTEDYKGFSISNSGPTNLAYKYDTGTGENYIYLDAYNLNKNSLYCMRTYSRIRYEEYYDRYLTYTEGLSALSSSQHSKIPTFTDSYGNPLAMYVLIYTGDREIAEGENYEIYCNYTDTDQYSFQIKGSSSFKINVNNEQKTLFNDKLMALSKGNLLNLDSTNLSITGALYGSSTISSYSISLYQYKNNKEYLIDESTYNFSQSIIYMYDNLLNNSNYLLYVKIRDSDNNIHEGYLL